MSDKLLSILMELIYTGMVDMRSSSSEGERIFAISDNLHNIPHMVKNNDIEGLIRYLRIDCPIMIEKVPTGSSHYLKLWSALEDEVSNAKIDEI